MKTLIKAILLGGRIVLSPVKFSPFIPVDFRAENAADLHEIQYTLFVHFINFGVLCIIIFPHTPLDIFSQLPMKWGANLSTFFPGLKKLYRRDLIS